MPSNDVGPFSGLPCHDALFLRVNEIFSRRNEGQTSHPYLSFPQTYDCRYHPQSAPWTYFENIECGIHRGFLPNRHLNMTTLLSWICICGSTNLMEKLAQQNQAVEFRALASKLIAGAGK
jgi:hypothetical protein